jgi:hypothetical protein
LPFAAREGCSRFTPGKSNATLAEMQLTKRERERGPPPSMLAVPVPPHHPPRMFVVSETQAAAIRTAFERGGELSAPLELRRLFPGITDNAEALGAHDNWVLPHFPC